jgi:dynein heavy chain
LEGKRALFPRFFFVSDPVLLEILGQGSEPVSINAHVRSIFDNIAELQFSAGVRAGLFRIISMSSNEGEVVSMAKPVEIFGNIEEWLTRVQTEMFRTVKLLLHAGIFEFTSFHEEFSVSKSVEVVEVFSEFVLERPAQALKCAIQTIWVLIAEGGLEEARQDKSAMPFAQRHINRILRELVMLTTKALTSLQRTKLETVITLQVHQKDVFDYLVQKHVKSVTDFEWLKQTRMYLKAEESQVLVQITDVEFEYAHEYLGALESLVITPLTDRCYITLAQALGLVLGGAPAGPAGTGKTETVKDLGHCLGKFVVVFNCSDQMDFRGMGKIFKGLAQSGAWGCFDEFNRIELNVLSVVAQQVQCTLTAIRENRKNFVFTDGHAITLDGRTGFFITMNPGYAGRTELPENLKGLFRSVAMMVPDREIIMRVKLASSGFQENQQLAHKFFVLYELCEAQLSKQRHYDFGLRNILSVLRSLGPSRRASETESEMIVFLRVVRDMNLSKLTAEDEPLFLSFMSDLFCALTQSSATGLSNRLPTSNGLVPFLAACCRCLQATRVCRWRICDCQ